LHRRITKAFRETEHAIWCHEFSGSTDIGRNRRLWRPADGLSGTGHGFTHGALQPNQGAKGRDSQSPRSLENGIGLSSAHFRIFGPRIGHLHVSDNNGRLDEHLPVGQGIIGFKAMARALKRIVYDNTLTSEIFSPNRDDLVTSRRKLVNIM
jgi:hypothetical protein